MGIGVRIWCVCVCVCAALSCGAFHARRWSKCAVLNVGRPILAPVEDEAIAANARGGAACRKRDALGPLVPAGVINRRHQNTTETQKHRNKG